MQAYYIIRETDSRVIAIHKIYDSACVCFHRIIQMGQFERYLEMCRIMTNEFGLTQHETTLFSYSKASQTMIDHVMDLAAAYVSPPTRIRIPLIFDKLKPAVVEFALRGARGEKTP